MSLRVKGVGFDFDEFMRASQFEYSERGSLWQRFFNCEDLDSGIEDTCAVLEPVHELIQNVPDSNVDGVFEVIIELKDLPESVAILGRIASSEAMSKLGRLRMDFQISVENPRCFYAASLDDSNEGSTGEVQ